MVRLSACLTCLVSFLVVSSQTISLNNYYLDGDEHVVVDFTIQQDHSSRELYVVDIYASHDNFRQPIMTLENVRVGQIIRKKFRGVETFGTYSGNLQLRIQARASAFPVHITRFDAKLKAGKPASIEWSDYQNYGTYQVGLFIDGQLQHELAANQTGTSFSGEVPSSIGKGKYDLRVTPLENRSMASDNIQVTVGGGSKVLLIAGGILAVGGGVAVLSAGGETGGSTNGGTGLPDPPGPPSGN